MSQRRIYLTLLLVFLSLLLAPVAQAQSTDLDFNQILRSLGPRTDGYDSFYIILDILLYAGFFLGFVNMFLIPEKQLGPTLMNFAVMLLIVFSKVGVANAFGADLARHPNAILSMCALPTLPVNAIIFVFPLIIAGLVRKTNKYGGSPPSLMVAILAGIVGGGYFFLAWATEIRNCGTIIGIGG